jgi:DNA-binding FrmR family transcriptional regulator
LSARSERPCAEDEVLNDHVAHCVEGAIASGDGAEQRRKVQEFLAVLTRRHG